MIQSNGSIMTVDTASGKRWLIEQQGRVQYLPLDRLVVNAMNFPDAPGSQLVLDTYADGFPYGYVEMQCLAPTGLDYQAIATDVAFSDRLTITMSVWFEYLGNHPDDFAYLRVFNGGNGHELAMDIDSIRAKYDGEFQSAGNVLISPDVWVDLTMDFTDGHVVVYQGDSVILDSVSRCDNSHWIDTDNHDPDGQYVNFVRVYNQPSTCRVKSMIVGNGLE